MRAHQVNYDYIGLTYYPFWQGSLTELEHIPHILADRYGKDITIAETSFPGTLSKSGPSVVATAQALPHAAEHPPTSAGQAAFFESSRRVLRDVPGGHCAGFFVSEPGWLPGVNTFAEVRTTHGNLTHFDCQGRGPPALEAFRPVAP